MAAGGRDRPKLTDAELLTLAVMQALGGYVSEARWLRYARTHLHGLFPYLPGQAGYNKRLRAAFPLLRYFIRALAIDTELWRDTVWVADSTPVECGRSRDTARRSALAGWAAYGYCRSHTRYFWGLRLHLVCTLHGLPVAFALANPKADEREVLVELLDVEPGLVAARPGLVILADKGYRDAETESILAGPGRAGPAAGLQGRGATARPRIVQAVAAAHRVGQRHPQGPTRPGTPRRADHPGRHRSGAATPAGPDRCHLAQPPDRPAGPALPDRLRPLLTLGINHLAGVQPIR
jgi:hypothetical protein